MWPLLPLLRRTRGAMVGKAFLSGSGGPIMGPPSVSEWYTSRGLGLPVEQSWC